jgi:hypothetical protein
MLTTRTQHISTLTTDLQALNTQLDALTAANAASAAAAAAATAAAAAMTQPAPTTASAQPDPALNLRITNLERENKLVASAWYDITSRLQSNTVILSRRAEPPRSWLGRQRAAVGQVGGLVSHNFFLFA